MVRLAVVLWFASVSGALAGGNSPWFGSTDQPAFQLPLVAEVAEFADTTQSTDAITAAEQSTDCGLKTCSSLQNTAKNNATVAALPKF